MSLRREGERGEGRARIIGEGCLGGAGDEVLPEEELVITRITHYHQTEGKRWREYRKVQDELEVKKGYDLRAEERL